VDLRNDVTLAELGSESSFTLIASRHADLFRRYNLPAAQTEVTGELLVNPLYHVERRGDSSILTLSFPTPEYEEEFRECRRYLPERVTIDADLSAALVPATFGSAYEELRRRRIVIDAPPRY
jgi:hypothetical protein